MLFEILPSSLQYFFNLLSNILKYPATLSQITVYFSPLKQYFTPEFCDEFENSVNRGTNLSTISFKFTFCFSQSLFQSFLRFLLLS